MHLPSLIYCLVCTALIWSNTALAEVAVDSRIKTYVYNEYEVFPLLLHWDYISFVDFAPGEQVSSVRMGNSSSWVVTTNNSSRIYLKALEGSAHTNMLVETNKRTYQFDLFSKRPDSKADYNMAYSLRFVYPKDKEFDLKDTQKAAPTIDRLVAGVVNAKYWYKGSALLLPEEIFDDGRLTFIKLGHSTDDIRLSYIGRFSYENKLNYHHYLGYAIIEGVYDRIVLRRGGDFVVLFRK